MNKWVNNFLFVMTTIFFMFVGIKNVDAKMYSYMNCGYTGNSVSESNNSKILAFTLNLKYTEDGKASIPSTTKVYFAKVGFLDFSSNQETYKVVNVNFKNSSFIEGKHLKPVCPGTNDVDFYVKESNKTIYIATSQSKLKEYLNKKNIKYKEVYLGKAKIGNQDIVNYSKIKIDNKIYDSEATISCEYKDKNNSSNKIKLYFGVSSGNLLQTSITNLDGITNPTITSINDTISGKECPKNVSLGYNKNSNIESNIGSAFSGNNEITRFYLYNGTSTNNNRINFELDQDSGSAYPIVLSDKTGCALWGSLLVILRDEIFAVVKYSLIGFLIVLGMLDFSKALFSGEDKDIKKAGSRFIKRIIAVIVIFLLPLLIETTINLILTNEGTDIETCISDF